MTFDPESSLPDTDTQLRAALDTLRSIVGWCEEEDYISHQTRLAEIRQAAESALSDAEAVLKERTDG
jgi:hypothetical protein